MDLRTKYRGFRRLIDYNFAAMERLSSLGYFPEGQQPKRIVNGTAVFPKGDDEVSAVTGAVSGMVEEYERLGGDVPVNRIKEKLGEVRSRASDTVASLYLAKRFGYDGASHVEQSAVYKELWRQFFEQVLNLSPEIIDPSKPSFAIENVKTLHDLVRFLHEKSIDAMFERGKIAEEGGFTYSVNSVYFNLLDINKPESKGKADVKSLQCKPLEAIVEAINPIEDGMTARIDTLLDNDYVNAHFALGCHSADLSAMLSGKGSFVDVKYNETGYPNAPRRQAYLEKVLVALGFKVNSSGRTLKAMLRDRLEDTTEKALKEAARALITCKDLDIGSYLNTNEDVEFAFKYFMNGGNYVRKVLRAKRATDKVFEKGLKYDEVLPWLEHSLKEKLKELDVQGKSAVKDYIAGRMIQAYGKGKKAVARDVNRIANELKYSFEKPEGFREHKPSSCANLPLHKIKELLGFGSGMKELISDAYKKKCLGCGNLLYSCTCLKYKKIFEKYNNISNIKEIDKFNIYNPPTCKTCGSVESQCGCLKPTIFDKIGKLPGHGSFVYGVADENVKKKCTKCGKSPCTCSKYKLSSGDLEKLKEFYNLTCNNCGGLLLYCNCKKGNK